MIFSQSNFKPPQRSNLKADEEKALQKLRKREDIVIKPADKGGTVVVWRKNLYCDEAKKQLSSEQFYTKLDYDITNKISKTIEKELKSIISKGELPKTALNLVVDNPKYSNFYMLPKIHKLGNLVDLLCPLVLARQL